MDFLCQSDPPPNRNPADWRSHVEPDSRHRIVRKITDALKRCFVYDGQEGLHNMRRAAINIEETCYTGAATQSAYLRELSLRIMELAADDYRDIDGLTIQKFTSTSIYLFETEPTT